MMINTAINNEFSMITAPENLIKTILYGKHGTYGIYLYKENKYVLKRLGDDTKYQNLSSLEFEYIRDSITDYIGFMSKYAEFNIPDIYTLACNKDKKYIECLQIYAGENLEELSPVQPDQLKLELYYKICRSIQKYFLTQAANDLNYSIDSSPRNFTYDRDIFYVDVMPPLNKKFDIYFFNKIALNIDPIYRSKLYYSKIGVIYQTIIKFSEINKTLAPEYIRIAEEVFNINVEDKILDAINAVEFSAKDLLKEIL